MRKNLAIFGIVVVVSLITAMVGHAYCPAFCMAVKPITWPFIALAVLAIRSLRKNERRSERDR